MSNRCSGELGETGWKIPDVEISLQRKGRWTQRENSLWWDTTRFEIGPQPFWMWYIMEIFCFPPRRGYNYRPRRWLNGESYPKGSREGWYEQWIPGAKNGYDQETHCCHTIISVIPNPTFKYLGNIISGKSSLEEYLLVWRQPISRLLGRKRICSTHQRSQNMNPKKEANDREPDRRND